MPSRPAERSTVAKTSSQSAMFAFEIHVFWPFSTNSSPSGSAVDAIEAASEP